MCGGGGLGSGRVGWGFGLGGVRVDAKCERGELIPTAYVKLITYILLSFIQKVDQTAVKHQFL